MDNRIRLGLVVLLGAVVPSASARAQAKLPTGVTQEMVDKGKAIFTGAGNCYACHGQNAQGMLGPTTNLTDATWVHSDGSYPQIAEYIKHGVTKEQSKSGIPMPPRGGSKITDDEVNLVAAYVYSLSHK
jgi:mono/diheme cytochrome c family protein